MDRRTDSPDEQRQSNDNVVHLSGNGAQAKAHGTTPEHLAAPSAAQLNALGPPGRNGRQRDKVIKFSNVSKRFILHHERPRSFQEMVVSLFGLRTPSKRGVAMPGPVREEFWALKDVNFGIYAGEAVGITGENGSGKSTMLKLISRILEPTSGSVSVKGKVSALLELGAGFHPDLTGRENIFLHGSLLGLSQKEMTARYQQIVEFAELEEFIDTPIKHYSSGMVMRLGFAVAINVDPNILLTDEVLAVGDEAFQRKCLDYISQLRRRGVTIIFVSHALEAVRTLCSRVLWLHQGKVMADGPAGEVIDRYLVYENEKHAARLRTDHARAADLLPAPSEDTAEEQAGESQMAHAGSNDHSDPETDGGQGVSDLPGSQWSRGGVEVTGVTFLNGDGEQTTLFHTEQPFVVRLGYRAQRRLDHPVFGLALYSENGTHLNGPNTRFAGLDIPYIEGEGYVEYRIEQLPLLAGRYDLTVAVTGADMTDLYVHHHRTYGFTVQPTPGLPERWGLVYMPAEWSFHPKREAGGAKRETRSVNNRSEDSRD